MATDDAVRYSLHRQLEEDYGPAEAALLMTGVPPFPWTEVATKRDLDLLGREVRSELREVRGELLEKIGALDGKISSQKWTLLAGYVVGTATIASVVLVAAQLG
jgi:hypothetical protein